MFFLSLIVTVDNPTQAPDRSPAPQPSEPFPSLGD